MTTGVRDGTAPIAAFSKSGAVPSLVAALPEPLAQDVRAVMSTSGVRRVLDTVCTLSGMGFSAIARVTDSRWIACSVNDAIDFGLEIGSELPFATTLCSEVREHGREIVIEDVSNDTAYATHACPAMYGFGSYISVPIVTADGEFFGTLCAIDPHPRQLHESGVVETFRLFADLMAGQIEASRDLLHAETELAEALSAGQLREELMGVLGHDLRNPLASISANAQLIGALGETPDVLEASGAIERSVYRMSELIANLLDLTRGRLGEGIVLEKDSSGLLGERLVDVVDEIRRTQPQRVIETHLDIPHRIDCDSRRLAQLLSNLLGNAVEHGRPGTPIHVEANVRKGRFELSVVNACEPIPEAVQAKLFQPFRRSERSWAAGGALGGLGLGLYIASEIARAHGGQMILDSDENLTRFAFSMPIDAVVATETAAPAPTRPPPD